MLIEPLTVFFSNTKFLIKNHLQKSSKNFLILHFCPVSIFNMHIGSHNWHKIGPFLWVVLTSVLLSSFSSFFHNFQDSSSRLTLCWHGISAGRISLFTVGNCSWESIDLAWKETSDIAVPSGISTLKGGKDGGND